MQGKQQPARYAEALGQLPTLHDNGGNLREQSRSFVDPSKMISNEAAYSQRRFDAAAENFRVDAQPQDEVQLENIESEISKLLGAHPWTNAGSMSPRTANRSNQPPPDWARMLVQSSLGPTETKSHAGRK